MLDFVITTFLIFLFILFICVAILFICFILNLTAEVVHELVDGTEWMRRK